MDCVQRFRGSSVMDEQVSQISVWTLVSRSLQTQAEKWLQNFAIFAVLHYATVANPGRKWLQIFAIFAILHYAMVAKPR
jgi:hypothetical protein